MDGLDRLPTLTLAAALGLLAAGCSGAASEPEIGTRPSEAMEEIERTKQAASDTASALPEPPSDVEDVAPTPAEATPEPVDRTRPVHFATASPEEEAAAPPTLFEASEAERLRRRDNPEDPSTIVITDANLSEFAKGGRLTEMLTQSSDDADAAANADTAGSSTTVDQETYWRNRVRDSRLAWRAAADRVAELQREVARLRFEFYSRDDPAYRDLEIKPAWDRAAVDLTQARLRVSELELQVEQVQAAGLEAGALPGWLREGLEFEPEKEDASEGSDRPGVAEAIEPPIMDDPPR